MAKEFTTTTLDLALQAVYNSCVGQLTPKNGECFIAAKVENGLFGSAVFGQNDNVALALFQFMSMKPEIMTSFFSILMKNSDFIDAFLSGMVNNSPEDVFKCLRERFLLVAIPNETPKEEMLETLDKIKATILTQPENETGNESQTEEEA